MAQTTISPDKLSAYRATEYRVGSGLASFVLRIGEKCDALQIYYKASDRSCGVFITAFNPFGQAQSDEANEAANARLGEHLRALAPEVLSGFGADPTGFWPPEPSFFALEIDKETAGILGRRWRQDAVVWVGEDGVPQLLVLR